METNKTKIPIKWKCRKHPNIACDFICLEHNAKDRVVCFKCMQKRLIPVSKVLQMSAVLAAKEHEILQFYPLLYDEDLSEKLTDANSQQLIEEIDLYFKKLKEDLEKELNAAQQRAKEYFIKQEKARQQLLDEYSRIAEIEKLKELILSEKEEAETELDNFIKDKWNQEYEYKEVLNKLIEDYENGLCLSQEELYSITQNLIQNIKRIDFNENKPDTKINLLKSFVGSSQLLKIKKIDNSTYSVKNRSNEYWSQVFIDPILDPNKKYIFHLEIEKKPQNVFNDFQFGLVWDKDKDDDCAFYQDMCYNENQNKSYIPSSVEGDLMDNKINNIAKHSFEVKIHINKQLLRVASLPEYQSIFELDPNKIFPEGEYRFFLSLGNNGDVIKVKKMEIVSNFDDNF